MYSLLGGHTSRILGQPGRNVSRKQWRSIRQTLCPSWSFSAYWFPGWRSSLARRMVRAKKATRLIYCKVAPRGPTLYGAYCRRPVRRAGKACPLFPPCGPPPSRVEKVIERSGAGSWSTNPSEARAQKQKSWGNSGSADHFFLHHHNFHSIYLLFALPHSCSLPIFSLLHHPFLIHSPTRSLLHDQDWFCELQQRTLTISSLSFSPPFPTNFELKSHQKLSFG